MSNPTKAKLHPGQFLGGVARITAALALLLALSGSPALAATPSPGFTVDSYASPTHFSESQNAACNLLVSADETCDSYEATVTNAGGAATGEEAVVEEPTPGQRVTKLVPLPVTVTDTIPKGLSVGALELIWSGAVGPENELSAFQQRAREDCRVSSERVVKCTWSKGLAPDGYLRLIVYVTVDQNTSGSLTNTVTAAGGGAPTVSSEPGPSTNEVNAVPAPFGTSNFNFFIDGQDGTRDTQAGDHPYELTTEFDLNDELRVAPAGSVEFASTGTVKDVVVDLPLGFVGSTLSAPVCTLAQLSSEQRCPANTIVGHLRTEPTNSSSVDSPVYNIVPERGYPAEFGYVDALKGAHVLYTRVVPTPQGYVLQTATTEIPEINIRRIVATFYGDPALRDGSGSTQIPFFTNPTACSNGPVVATLYMDSWQDPGTYDANGAPDLGDGKWAKSESASPPVNGCNALTFTPELVVAPTTHEADKPSGLEFETKLAQSEVFGGNATPALKDLTVTFPQGMTVDPSSADGLGVCSEAQIGWQGPTLFDFSPARPECPESSKIGSLELETPLIPGKIDGEVFLASQDANPFGSTFAIYVVVNDPRTGVVLKIAGELKADPQTGQLTSVFDENPQLPFSVLSVHFFGGPRAELATPPSCGIYTTSSALEPWSAPDSGPIGTPFSSYAIDEDCAIGFNPAFTGGTTNLQAGAYTTFQASFERQDADQELGGAEVNLPPGMLADVPSVTECGAAELAAEAADAPTGGCPASSKVGTVEAGAGPGPDPLFVPGNVFWTGPYKGGPFGLAVVVSANPGPFHFGNVLVRQSIRIDPLTAAVTDVSDAFPTYLDPVGADGQTTGIPIKLRRVDIEVNRPGFTFNPTSCAKETFKVGGAITSTQGASRKLSTPFQVTNCAHLKFAPKFSVSTSGKTSKARGASLTAKVAYPSGSQGIYADIAKVKVELPKQLPSRLTTLQKACTAAQFNADPAGCPSASMIGHATVRTPILPGVLSGPAIFVSHGGEAFPSLTLVLQGDGVTIDLVGATFISKTGITSTTFKTVPDSPFAAFELTLPEGKYSALAANGNLCTQKLTMPNEFIGQNGAKITESTPVSVTGCKKTKALTRAQKLKAALKACHKKAKGKQAQCEKAARNKLGPVKKRGK
jgi:hypothetical protein